MNKKYFLKIILVNIVLFFLMYNSNSLFGQQSEGMPAELIFSTKGLGSNNEW